MISAEATPTVHHIEDERLGALGMPSAVSRVYREALAHCAGLVLVAGAAGAGKTATLEAGLHAIEDRGSNAVVVVEIRDSKTAKVAIEAALNGRLIVSTIESRSALDAIARLRGFEVERFLIAAFLRAVIAQRLLRRLCPACREPVKAQGSETSLLGFDPGAVVYRSAGCEQCRGSGYQGRIGVFEAVRIDETLRRLIDRGDDAVVASHAFRHVPTLAAAARALVSEGVTSAEEAILLSRTPSG